MMLKNVRIKNIPRSTSAFSFRTGCDLKGPYVQPCENTYTKQSSNYADAVMEIIRSY